MCSTCVIRLPRKGLKTCQVCADRSLARRQSQKAKGLCEGCTRPRAEGSKLCEYHRQKRRELYYRLKLAVLAHYGRVCVCCGEEEPEFLTMDHIEGGGLKHRTQIAEDTGERNFYKWLNRESFPKGFRVLCRNCNFSAHLGGGTCSHQRPSIFALD